MEFPNSGYRGYQGTHAAESSQESTPPSIFDSTPRSNRGTPTRSDYVFAEDDTPKSGFGTSRTIGIGLRKQPAANEQKLLLSPSQLKSLRSGVGYFSVLCVGVLLGIVFIVTLRHGAAAAQPSPAVLVCSVS